MRWIAIMWMRLLSEESPWKSQYSQSIFDRINTQAYLRFPEKQSGTELESVEIQL